MLMTPHDRWTNPSVTAFAAGGDPVNKMIQAALGVALGAIQDGWKGPPFDPFLLAEQLNIRTVPREDVDDARTVPIGSGKIQIEYNPSRPKQRIRYSIAHEIAHTFFHDCSESIRNRAPVPSSANSEWELEMLCNIGAAELLMPTGIIPDFKAKRLSVEGLLNLRKQYEVSAESLALRYVNITEQPAAVFVASRKDNLASADQYHIDYLIASRGWPMKLPKGFKLPKETIVGKCTAIGYTTKGQEKWAAGLGQLNIECVGLPSYSNSIFPRVLGIMHPTESSTEAVPRIQYILGDATRPSGSGPRILVHVVNDKTPNWGAGFGLVVRETWPPVQEEFRSWAHKNPSQFGLGHVFMTQISDDFFVSPMVCQHGYGPSEKPRLRYTALKACLEQVMTNAIRLKASVHMPRIGVGFGGGSWGLIEQLIDENLCRFGIPVTVYDLPSRKHETAQSELFGQGRS